MTDFRRDLLLLPNLISLGRIVIVFVAAGLYIDGHHLAALFLGIPAGLSDYLDGYIARKRGQSTELGALLDGLADILFQLICFSIAVHYRIWPTYLLIVWGTRDMSVTMIRASAGQQGFFIRSTFLAKLAMNFNYYAFIFMAVDVARPFSHPRIIDIVHWVGLGGIHAGLAMQLISGYQYFKQYAANYSSKGRKA
jgi:CDP-diacylglycerol--glycerol-3-phosphate 3-phosphatidyltransferase